LAYVRKKEIKGGVYHQLVENRRIEGEPRQRVLVHLGKHERVDDALQAWPGEIGRLRRLARERRDKVPDDREPNATDRLVLKQAESAKKRADALEANLEKLRDLRERGVT
jgi:hypothetical protein